ncbi:MAG TPA: AbrB/MazE/SpoVT family DNA-binding domain-containing protein [Gemmatimonadaceae bacterium]
MKPTELRITRIGNSRGIRLPAETIKRYGIGDTIIMEQRSDGIFLRPSGPATEKLSWEDTAREMEAAAEDWSDWDAVSGDGLDEIPWDTARVRRVAEPTPLYSARKKSNRKHKRS